MSLLQKETIDETSDKSMATLRRSKSGLLGHLNKLYRRVEEAMMSNDNEELVKSLQKDIQTAFTKFQMTNQQLMDELSDRSEIQACVVSMQKCEQGKVDIDTLINDWFLHLRTEHLNSSGAVEDVSVPGSRAPSRGTSRTRSSISITSSKQAELDHKLAELEFKQLERRMAVEKERESRLLAVEKERELRLLAAREKVEITGVTHQVLSAANTDVPDKSRNVSTDSKHVSFQEDPDQVLPSTSAVGTGALLPEITRRMQEILDSRTSPAHNMGSNLNPEAPSYWERPQVNVERPPVNREIPQNQINQESQQNGWIGELVKSFKLITDAILTGVDLPRPDIPKFSGEPTEYAQFMHSFKTFIEPKLSNDSLKLEYLLRLCDDNTRKCIGHCVFLNDRLGYEEAQSILKDRFGNPHLMSHEFVKQLTDGKDIKSNDFEGMLNLATEMRRCGLVLSSLGYWSDLHNSESLLKIVKRLPFNLQSKWVYRAQDIIDSGREPNFDDLTAYVNRSANVMCNFYGQGIHGESEKNSQSRKTTWSSRYNTFASSGAPDPEMSDDKIAPCFVCEKPHYLYDCDEYEELSQADRAELLRNNNACFNCFNPGHLAVGCLATRSCTESGCYGKHHSSLHDYVTSRPAYSRKFRPKRWTSEESNHTVKAAVNCSVSCTRNKVCLRVIPVKLCFENKCVEVQALLDSGSDVSLVSSDLIDKLGVPCVNTTFSINTFNDVGNSTEGKCVSLDVMSHDQTQSVKIERALCVDKLSITNDSIPTLEDIEKWSHLNNLDFTFSDVPQVDLLIGCDVPEVFWVTDQRVGKKGEPYAVKGPLGWSLIGPTKSYKDNSDCTVNFVQSNSIGKDIAQLWNSDFHDLNSVERSEMSVNEFQVLKNTKSSDGCVQCDPELCAKYEGTISKYIPHHAVYYPEEDELRNVFNCAMKYQDKSFNTFMYSGPDLASNLTLILISFRVESVAMTLTEDSDLLLRHKVVHTDVDWGDPLSLDPEALEL